MVHGVDSIWSSMGYAAVLLIYFRVDRVLSADIRALINGGLYHIVSYGVFGENRTQDFLRGREGLFQNLNFSFHALLEWSSAFNLIPCSNFLKILDHCNLRV